MGSVGYTPAMDSKHCTRCFQFLPLDSFGRVTAASDGRAGDCRACHRVAVKEYKDRLRARKVITVPLSKPCPLCGKTKPGAQFPTDKASVSGLATYCRSCTADYASARYKVYRDELDGIKLAAGCKDCGYDDNPRRLEFDHLPGFEKCFNVSEGVLYPRDELYAEIAKCEVVCQPCHSRRTTQRMREARLCMTVSL